MDDKTRKKVKLREESCSDLSGDGSFVMHDNLSFKEVLMLSRDDVLFSEDNICPDEEIENVNREADSSETEENPDDFRFEIVGGISLILI